MSQLSSCHRTVADLLALRLSFLVQLKDIQTLGVIACLLESYSRCMSSVERLRRFRADRMFAPSRHRGVWATETPFTLTYRRLLQPPRLFLNSPFRRLRLRVGPNATCAPQRRLPLPCPHRRRVAFTETLLGEPLGLLQQLGSLSPHRLPIHPRQSRPSFLPYSQLFNRQQLRSSPLLTIRRPSFASPAQIAHAQPPATSSIPFERLAQQSEWCQREASDSSCGC